MKKILTLTLLFTAASLQAQNPVQSPSPAATPSASPTPKSSPTPSTNANGLLEPYQPKPTGNPPNGWKIVLLDNSKVETSEKIEGGKTIKISVPAYRLIPITTQGNIWVFEDPNYDPLLKNAQKETLGATITAYSEETQDLDKLLQKAITELEKNLKIPALQAEKETTTPAVEPAKATETPKSSPSPTPKPSPKKK